MPPLEHAGANFRLAPPTPLVGQRHVADRQARRGGHLQEVVARAIRIGQQRVIVRELICAASASSTTNPPPIEKHVYSSSVLPLGIAGREPHAIRMLRQRFLAQKEQIRRLVKRNRRPIGKRQPAALANRRHPRLDFIRIDPFGRRPFEPEQNRLIRPVPLAGERERSIQPHLDRRRPIEHALRAQPLDELPRRPHRPNRVRTRRPDADREQIEDADRHVDQLYARRVIAWHIKIENHSAIVDGQTNASIGVVEPELAQAARRGEIEDLRNQTRRDDDRVPTLAADTLASRPERAARPTFESTVRSFRASLPDDRRGGAKRRPSDAAARAAARPAFTEAIISASGSTRTA